MKNDSWAKMRTDFFDHPALANLNKPHGEMIVVNTLLLVLKANADGSTMKTPDEVHEAVGSKEISKDEWMTHFNSVVDAEILAINEEGHVEFVRLGDWVVIDDDGQWVFTDD